MYNIDTLSEYFGFSKTRWETSYYGGVKRILTEYPFIRSSYELHCYSQKDCKADKDLTLYQFEKMVSILFNTYFQDINARDSFQHTMALEYERIVNDPKLLRESIVKGYKEDKVRIDVDCNTLSKMLAVCRNNSELAPIFKEYGDDLLLPGSKVYITLSLPGQYGDIPDKSDDSDEQESVDAKKSEAFTQASQELERIIKSFKNGNNIEDDFSVQVQEVRKTIETSISNDEILFANKLFGMLDITQDPKADTVKNLYQGKIDDEKLSEVLSGNNRIHMRRVENESVKPFKVVVLGDLSGSMRYNFRLPFQISLMKSLYYLFNNLLKIQDFEFWGHSGEEQPILYKYHTPEYPHFLKTIDKDIENAENYDGPIIQELHKLIRAKSDKAVLFISLSDGQPSGICYGGKEAEARMKQIMEKAKRDNFVTVGIGIQYFCSPGLYQYSVVVNNLDETYSIAQVINKAVKENLVID